jgi:rare lipoprotein A
LTADGERFDMNQMTAAHRTLPFRTVVRVTDAKTGTMVKVRINDRGPFRGNRVLDLSAAAAKALGIASDGTAKVSIETYASDQTPL